MQDSLEINNNSEHKPNIQIEVLNSLDRAQQNISTDMSISKLVAESTIVLDPFKNI